MPGQTSGKKGFAGARTNSRPGRGYARVLGQISGPRRGFASARAYSGKFHGRERDYASARENFMPNKWFHQC